MNKALQDIADYLATLKKESEYQKTLFYKEIFTPRKTYGFKACKEEEEDER